MERKYPGVRVSLTKVDGNAHVILGVVRRSLKNAGVSTEEQDAFYNEATSGDYDHLIQTCMRWVTVD